MHPIMPRRYDALRLDPELATLAILDAALQASRAALIAEHPDARCLDDHQEQIPPVVILASLVVARAKELRALLAHYRRAVDDFRVVNRGDDLPF